ncbi:MAG: flavoprotein [Candidatus Omnitrophota bacterium]
MRKSKKNILVGVCGGIAAYKTCELIRLLVEGGFSVKVVMTESASKFVSALVFQTLSRNHAYQDMFSLPESFNPRHIGIAGWADLCVIAPLSANTLSKIACGICDNLLTAVICALPKETKVLLAPAMNENMWVNPVIKKNIQALRKLEKYIFLTPRKGELACGVYGTGRLEEPAVIYKKITALINAPVKK